MSEAKQAPVAELILSPTTQLAEDLSDVFKEDVSEEDAIVIVSSDIEQLLELLQPSPEDLKRVAESFGQIVSEKQSAQQALRRV